MGIMTRRRGLVHVTCTYLCLYRLVRSTIFNIEPDSDSMPFMYIWIELKMLLMRAEHLIINRRLIINEGSLILESSPAATNQFPLPSCH